MFNLPVNIPVINQITKPLSNINPFQPILTSDPFNLNTSKITPPSQEQPSITPQITFTKPIIKEPNFNDFQFMPQPIAIQEPRMVVHKEPHFEALMRPEQIAVLNDPPQFTQKDPVIIQQNLPPTIINNYFQQPSNINDLENKFITIDNNLKKEFQNLNNSISQSQFNTNQRINDVTNRQDKLLLNQEARNTQFTTDINKIESSLRGTESIVAVNQNAIKELSATTSESIKKINESTEKTLLAQNAVDTVQNKQLESLQSENKRLENLIIENRKAPVVHTIGSNDVFRPQNQKSDNNNNLALLIIPLLAIIALNQ